MRKKLNEKIKKMCEISLRNIKTESLTREHVQGNIIYMNRKSIEVPDRSQDSVINIFKLYLLRMHSTK